MTRLLVCASVLLCSGVASAGGDWNDAGIQWRSLEDGLAEAKRDSKPVCLVFYTEWCPHCTNYSQLFHRPMLVEASKGFVMVRVDKDKNPELSSRYAVDGEYIPRTYFLGPSGEMWRQIHAPRKKYKYFFNQRDPADVLAAMARARSELAPK